jgi:monoamine oxidase
MERGLGAGRRRRWSAAGWPDSSRDVQRGGRSGRVLEARGRVGGRVWREATARGHVVERGGQLVGPSQVGLLALAAELGVESFERHHTGHAEPDRRLRVGRRRAHRTHGRARSLAATLRAGMQCCTERAVEWDRQT